MPSLYYYNVSHKCLSTKHCSELLHFMLRNKDQKKSNKVSVHLIQVFAFSSLAVKRYKGKLDCLAPDMKYGGVETLAKVLLLVILFFYQEHLKCGGKSQKTLSQSTKKTPKEGDLSYSTTSYPKLSWMNRSLNITISLINAMR